MELLKRKPEFIITGQTPDDYVPIGIVTGIANAGTLGKGEIRSAIEKAQKDLWSEAIKLGGTAISNYRISRAPSGNASLSAQSIIVYGDAIKKV